MQFPWYLTAYFTYSYRYSLALICLVHHSLALKNNKNQNNSAYDSGSPILIAGDTPEQDTLVALVSWGEECADPQFPGVNARVSDAFDWIRANICAMSDDPPPDLCAPSAFESNVEIVDDSWSTMLWLALSIVFGVTTLLLIADRLYYNRYRCLRNQPQNGTPSPDCSISSKEELEELNGARPTFLKLQSYDSTGVEITGTT